MTQMRKWAKGRDEALPITISILQCLQKTASKTSSLSLTQCVFDAVCLGIQTGSRCSEYCCRSPTSHHDKFCKVPDTHYSGNFASHPIAFTASDFTFLDKHQHFVSEPRAKSDATFLQVSFHFDKGGTGNIQFRTFQHFPPDRDSFCPLLAVLRTLTRWRHFNLAPLTPVFCYNFHNSPEFLHDSSVTTLLCSATQATYPDSNHLFNARLKDIRTHSLRVTACLILFVAKLPTPTIEHRLRWASTAWKVYVRKSLSHIHSASASASSTSSNDSANPQAYDIDNLL